MSSNDAESWAWSEAKDWKDGRHSNDNDYVQDHAGEIDNDRRGRQLLSAMHRAFERSVERGWIEFDAETPDTVRETLEYRDIRSHHATEGFDNAVANGESGTVRQFVGSDKRAPDVSGWRTIKQIESLITGEAAMLYVYGHMGNGKSFFASLVAEIWKEIMGEDAVVASNTRSIEAAKAITTWPALQDWMVEREEIILSGNQRRKLYIFDEASSQASGRGSDGWDASTKLAVMCYKIRKYGGSLIIIGHDGKDVHPAVREMCVAFHKTDTKTGQFFQEVNNRKGKMPLTEPLEGIPEPDKMWQPNTNDLAKWSWSSRDDGDDYEASEAASDMAVWTAIRCKEDGLSNREAAKFVPYSYEWVRTRWNEYNKKGMHQDTVAKVEQVIA